MRFGLWSQVPIAEASGCTTDGEYISLSVRAPSPEAEISMTRRSPEADAEAADNFPADGLSADRLYAQPYSTKDRSVANPNVSARPSF